MEKLDAELVTALIKARKEIPEIPKNKEARAGSFTYKYADLGDIISIITPVLLANDLLLTQPVNRTEQGVVLQTIVFHKNGSFISSTCDIPTEKLSAQQVGSWITYMRRYTLCGILGIHPEDDTDGTDAISPGYRSPPNVARPRSAIPTPAVKQKTFDEYGDIPL